MSVKDLIKIFGSTWSDNEFYACSAHLTPKH